MFTEEDKIRLIHKCRTVLLNQIFDDLSRRPGSGAERVSDEIIATAQGLRCALSESEAIASPARGLFVLALRFMR